MRHPQAHDAGMAHFDPWGALRPCWHCTRYDGLVYGGTAALCNLPNAARVRSSPVNGCSAWQREPGADDEPDRRPEPITTVRRIYVVELGLSEVGSSLSSRR